MAENVEKYLHFLTGSQSFLMHLRHMHRIILNPTPKPLPFVPDYIRGVIHFEGNIWVVVDLDTALGYPADESPEALILVRHQEYHLALRSRRARDIVTVAPERREKRTLAGIPDSCSEFITVLEGSLTCCLKLEEFIREFGVR